MSNESMPGAVVYGEGDLWLNQGRTIFECEVTNTGDRAIQVGSHFHFFEVNRALRFARRETFGMRLDIPSGTSVRFEAGQTHQVTLVAYGGLRRIIGFNNLTRGEDAASAIARAEEQHFPLDEGARP